MEDLARQVCFYVPRKLRKLLSCLCVSFAVIVFLLVTHIFGFYVGIASREYSMNDNEIIAAIPKQMNTDELALNIQRQVQEYDATLAQKQKDAMFAANMEGLGDFASLTCSVQEAKVVIFVRLPKCASTSFVNILKRLSKTGDQHRQIKLSFDPSGASDWNTETMTKVAKLIKIESESSQLQYVYARHFYYVDFTQFNLWNFTYITIVRDPVSRFISSFLYYHYSSRLHIKAILDPKHRNESLKTCLDLGHEGCQLNLMTKYFCGHEKPLCKKGSIKAYQRAKENIDKHFSIIGVMEEMSLSYKLMKHLLPKHFYNLNPDVDSLLVQNKNEREMNIPQSLREEIEEKNKYDLMLYYYIREKLYVQARVCSII